MQNLLISSTAKWYEELSKIKISLKTSWRNYLNKKPPLKLRVRLSESRDWCQTNGLVLDELALQKRGSAGPMHHILCERTSESWGGKKKQRSQQRWKSVWVVPLRSTPHRWWIWIICCFRVNTEVWKTRSSDLFACPPQWCNMRESLVDDVFAACGRFSTYEVVLF